MMISSMFYMIEYEEIINNLGKEKNYFNDYLKLI